MGEVKKWFKLRKNTFGCIYFNGTIEIEGITYIYHSVSSAKAAHRKKYPCR
jgi:hypothetical protein